jgi:hypothetical protein
MAVHPTHLVRFLIPLLAAVTLGAPPASAADSRHPKHSVRVVVPAQTQGDRQRLDSLDGVLVAPGCPSCRNQTDSPSVIDWVKAQLQRLAA